ncbi:hypothetical protein ACS0TY_014247 [Phlomoides rotata]
MTLATYSTQHPTPTATEKPRNGGPNQEAVSLFFHMIEERIVPSEVTMVSVMKERDVSSWTAVIGAMAMEGNGEGALDLFNEMLGQEIKPDEVVFTGVLTARSHGGLVEQGKHIFNSMKEQGITPHIVHYGCIVDIVGRAGLLDEALDFITRMPIESNAEIWSAFLGACRIYKNEKMASQAYEIITKSGRDKTGIHVWDYLGARFRAFRWLLESGVG